MWLKKLDTAKENLIQELQELFGKPLVKSYTLIKRDKKEWWTGLNFV